jgi:glycosyltransferase involved in cell wall biosynthesis
MKFSIIIPTHNRADSLLLAMKSLMSFRYSKKEFEIIVVDNDSSDATKEIVDELKKISPIRIKYVFEKRLGLVHARHTGAKAAEGKILYYIDDDIIATKSVLRELEKMFKLDSRIACVTGKIFPKWEEKPPNWFLRYFNNGTVSVNGNRKDVLLVAPYDVMMFGCHYAVRKEVLFRVGGFNPDSVGEKWLGDGETGLSFKIKKLGYLFAYTDKAVIYHRISVNRMNQKYINHRFANQGRAQSFTDLRNIPKNTLKIVSGLGGYVFLFIFNAAQTFVCLPFWNRWHFTLAKTSYYLARVEYDLDFLLDHKLRRFVLKKSWL